MDPIRRGPPTAVLLAALWLASEAGAAPSRRRFAQVPALSVRVSALAGERANSLEEIDALLQQNGYTHTPLAQHLLGFELGTTIRRLRLEIGVAGTVGDRVESLYNSHALRVHRGWISPELGYDVYRDGAFAVFPMLGYAAGDLLVDMDCQRPPFFTSYFSRAPCTRNLRRGFDALKVVVGFEEVLPLWRRGRAYGGIVFGARLGYVQQLGQSAWRTGDRSEVDLAGGPDADFSGPFVLLTLGVGVFKP